MREQVPRKAQYSPETHPYGDDPEANKKNQEIFAGFVTFARRGRKYPHKATVTATKVVFKVAPEALQCAGKEKSFQRPL
jgi:hypothetical protein